LKTVIREVVAEDLDAWKETLEIMADKRLMKQIQQAEYDWMAKKDTAYRRIARRCVQIAPELIPANIENLSSF
jgi:hypothetical protein